MQYSMPHYCATDHRHACITKQVQERLAELPSWLVADMLETNLRALNTNQHRRQSHTNFNTSHLACAIPFLNQGLKVQEVLTA